MRFSVQGSLLLLLVYLYSASALARLDDLDRCRSEVTPTLSRECLSMKPSPQTDHRETPRTEILAWKGLATEMTRQGDRKGLQTGPLMDGQGARSATPRPPSRLSSRLEKPSGTLLESRLYRRSKKKVERQPPDRLDVIYPMHSR